MNMNKILILIFLLATVYQGWKYCTKPEPPEPLYQTPYIIVYGRDACGYSQLMRSNLESARIPYIFEIVDKAEVAKILHKRMEASGIDTSSYYLPVVDLNGRISVRPEPSDIIAGYRSSTSGR